MGSLVLSTKSKLRMYEAFGVCFRYEQQYSFFSALVGPDKEFMAFAATLVARAALGLEMLQRCTRAVDLQ